MWKSPRLHASTPVDVSLLLLLCCKGFELWAIRLTFVGFLSKLAMESAGTGWVLLLLLAIVSRGARSCRRAVGEAVKAWTTVAAVVSVAAAPPVVSSEVILPSVDRL